MEGVYRGISAKLGSGETLGDGKQRTATLSRPAGVTTARVLPAYRAPFFDLLASACEGGLSVFAGPPLPVEHIAVAEGLEMAHYVKARNRHFAHPGSPYYQCWQPGIVDWLEDWGPGALIVEANARYPSTRRAIRWMHARGRPVLGWGLGAPPLSGRLAGWRARRRANFLNSLDALIAYSQQGAAQYRALGFPSGRIFVAPNAVAARPKRLPPTRADSFQERPAVLFVGRLQARKRVDYLLRACRDAAAGAPAAPVDRRRWPGASRLRGPGE